MSKYLKYKKRVFILVGIVAILITEPWWPSAIGFLLYFFGGSLSSLSILILANVFIPLSLIIWFTAFTDLLYKDKQKIILLILIIYGILFEIFFFSFLLINPTIIGEVGENLDVDYGLFILLNQAGLLVVILASGTIFARESFKSDDPEIRLKGKLLLVAFYSFLVGAVLDIASQASILILIIARFILIIAAISFYGGFILPNWMKKLFLKSNENR